MGSGSSKDDAEPAAEASSSSHNSSTGRSRKARLVIRVLNSSSCFGRSSSVSAVVRPKVEEDERSKGATCVSRNASNSVRENPECAEMAACAHHNKVPSLPSSDGNQSGEEHDNTLPRDIGSNSSNASSAFGGTSSSSGRFRSRFSFIPEGISFRLNRTVSLGSTHAHPLFPAAPYVPNSGSDISPILNLNDSSNNPISTQDIDNTETSSSQDVEVCAGAEATVEQYPIRNILESNTTAVRPSYRRIGPQEPLEGSVRFSRTLSVGRLRDRVLRRTALSDGLFGPTFLEDGSFGHYRHGSGRRLLTGVRRTSLRRNNEVVPDSSATLPSRTISSLDINGDSSSDANHRRERDLFEHRSAFLERRRRIRSQVRALQRLGNRFESLSGHDRSCILSGQHRTGHCTCGANNRTSNPDDDTGTRASISRIVMLAEALFEVLDEIHQQSVVLSSRPSFSSIGSVPAPKEVVDCIPVKMYSKPSKLENEEDAQCYICLMEYEEGDCMRILPCKHEFHRACVDKWLKEIHRVCPLCRRDVCSRDDAPGKGKQLIS